MIVEEIRGDAENFPAGMRVLAVDDDPTCLKLLETLLRKCQYSVTTTSQARVALNMIRENKDRFDLVICDVHMPGMDGFKLLELVGLEMDLPVIMLSANGDPELVMKGVTHGACDYLVKPVRIEELRNIWQHVIRRKKFDSKNQNRSSDLVKAHQARGEGHGSPLAGNKDQNGKFNRKRKDDEDEIEDNGNKYEEPGTQKKPRVAWSGELHGKFVTAVHQLGIKKAVPKRILEVMNVEGLTRENVASHLQKFRLYLRKMSSEQAHAAAAVGVKDSGFGDFRISAGARLSNSALSPYGNGVMLSRLNSPGNVNLRNLTPSTLVQPSQAQNLSNSINSLGSMHLEGFGNQFAQYFKTGVSGSSNSLDPVKCNGNWHNSVEVSEMHPNALFSAEPPFPSQLLPPNGLIDDISANGPYVALPPFEDSREMQCQLGSLGDVQNVNHFPANGIIMPDLDPMMNMDLGGRSSGTSARMQQNEDGKMAIESRSNKDVFLYEQPKSGGEFAPHGCDSMDELVNAMLLKVS